MKLKQFLKPFAKHHRYDKDCNYGPKGAVKKSVVTIFTKTVTTSNGSILDHFVTPWEQETYANCKVIEVCLWVRQASYSEAKIEIEIEPIQECDR